MASVRFGLRLFALVTLLAAFAQAQQRQDPNCFDREPLCFMWAHRGECYKNRGFMSIYCARSCQLCLIQDHRCRDENRMCAGWASKGECRSNKPYMEKMCARSCAFCMSARDHRVPHVHSDLVAKKWKEWGRKHPNLA